MSDEIKSRFAGPKDSPGYLLWRVTNRWQQRMRATLQPLGLTHVQFVLLAVTAWSTRDGEPVTQIQVADAAGTDEMMTSQVLRTLERNGLIVRAPHPNDARARSLRVTDAGKSLAAEAMVRVEEADAAFFDALGECQQGLIEMLRTLIE